MPREGVRMSNFPIPLQNTAVGDLLKFYALKLNKRIHFFNELKEGAIREPKTFSADTIDIDVNNFPFTTKGETCSYKTVKVFGKEYGFGGMRFLGSPVGEDEKPIMDELNQEIARVFYNTIYIFFELIPSSTKDLNTSFDILRYILEKSVDLLNFDDSKRLAIQQKESLGAYTRLLKEGFAKEKVLVKQRIELSQKEISEFCQRLQKAYRHIQEDQELYTLLESHENETLEKRATDDFEKMQKMIARGIYENIHFSNGVCVATTGKCYFAHEGKRFFAGRFEIKIGKEKIDFENLEYSDKKGYSHPHISSSGNPCFGNIGTELSKLVGNKEYILALELIFRYLNSYNHSDAFVKYDSGSNWIWEEVDAEGKAIKKRKKKEE